MPNFNDILSKKAEDIVKPKPKPIGTYLGVIQGVPKQRAVAPRDGGDEMEVLRFTVKRISPQEDVASDELHDHPPVSEWPPLNHDIFVNTEAGQWACKTWLENSLGIDSEGKSLGEMLAETPGKQLLVKTKHRPFINKQNEPETADEIESTAHV